MTQTRRLKLNKPEEEDDVDISVLNENMDKIETEADRLTKNVENVNRSITNLNRDLNGKETKTLRVMNITITPTQWVDSTEQTGYIKKYTYSNSEIRETNFSDVYYQTKELATEIEADLVLTKNGKLEIFAKSVAKENIVFHLMVHR